MMWLSNQSFQMFPGKNIFFKDFNMKFVDLLRILLIKYTYILYI